MTGHCNLISVFNIGKTAKLGLRILALWLGTDAAFAQSAASMEQVQYRIHDKGNSTNKVTAGSFVYLRLTGKTPSAAPLFQEKYWLKINEDRRSNSLHNVLRQFAAGDSGEVTLSYGLLLESMVGLPRIAKMRAKDKIKMGVRILRVVDDNIIFYKEYNKFCQLQEQQEQYFIQRFMNENSGFVKQKSGIYMRTLRRGNGIRKGNVVLLSYTGRFLNGVKFDNTPPGDVFRYVRGVQSQMITGIVLALAEMSEGAKAQVLIPYKLAFKDKGLADIVPPFMPVLYDIEVLKQ